MEKQLFDLPTLEGMHPEYGLMASMLADATREWREELGEISPAGIVWQPFPNGHSIGAILLHMADVESYWIEEFCLGIKPNPAEKAEFLSKQTDQDNVQWPTPPKKPLSYYFDLQDRVRERTLRRLAALPEPSVVKKRKHYLFSMGWVVNHVIGHESYHGGQVVLLKELYRKRSEPGK